MPQSLCKIYVHLIFSTKYRQPIIDDEIKKSLWKYMGCICKEVGCNPVQIGGYYDHIHILCVLSKNIALVKLVEEVKKRSSKWIKTNGIRYSNFYWQDGYGVFSVNPSEN